VKDLENYIRTKNPEALEGMRSTLNISEEDSKLADLIFTGITAYPPSKYDLVIEQVAFEGGDGGDAVTVISQEALEGGGAHIAS
jgi:hypothetical protein